MELVIPPKEKIIKTSDEDCSFRYNQPVVRHIYLKRLNMVFDLVKNERFKNLLEVGYGSGVLMQSLRQVSNNAVGIDIHDKRDEVAKLLPGNYRKMNVEKLEFPDNSFDCVVAVSVFEHFDDLRSVLREVKRVLKPNGTLIIGVPIESTFVKTFFFLTKSHALHYHKRKWDKILDDVGNEFVLEKKNVLPFIYCAARYKCQK